MPNTKNALAREFCVNEFEKELKRRKPAMIFSLVSVSILGIILILLGFLLMDYVFVIGLIFNILFALMISFSIWVAARDFYIMRKLKKGEFSIVEDTVTGKSEGKILYWYMGRQSKWDRQDIRNDLVDFLHFEHYEKFIPTRAVFEYTKRGDVFYLVVLNGKKRAIDIYHSDMYELKEN